MKQKHLSLFVVLAGLSACQSLPKVTRTNAVKPSLSEISFATFSAHRTKDQSCNIELIEYHYVNGIIKENPKTGFLYPVEVFLTDSADRVLNKFTIGHPLIEDFEFSDNHGQLKRMLRTIDSSRFYLRFNRLPGMDLIRFQSKDPSLPVINSTLKLKP
jgi:hypothetical protein